MTKILIPVSLGELYDKISILEIKKLYIKESRKLENISREYDYLQEILSKQNNFDTELYKLLKNINHKLWEVEDNIRIKENKKEFDNQFIEPARTVYQLNDERALVKQKISLKYNSEIVEEKSYEKYN